MMIVGDATTWSIILTSLRVVIDNRNTGNSYYVKAYLDVDIGMKLVANEGHLSNNF